jgi:hypothetical protein
MKRLFLAAVAVLALAAPASAKDPAFVWPKNSQFRCTGILMKRDAYQLHPDKGMLTWCDAELADEEETRVLKTCAPGDRCEIKGIIKGHGAFSGVKIHSVRRISRSKDGCEW